ncbi:hypothetical protein DUNSADRAFT_18391 [Dunaliella salina]|uniref:Annexin n=1 Tax=Dunaliella salina TaxID=3046 RepID=A0ABQ7G055_DUNSA|nr:hypothetical protein DUNSADRAFT_18391 [Dunaliella salina]|eukprot:KAF5827985.1 hypothetical protein DUNSADRAFT_18391 [Dunaliella salina]
MPYHSAYRAALVATLMTPMEFAVNSLFLAMKEGLVSKDERAMIQILAHATKDEVEHLKEAYLRIRQRTLESDIRKEFSGKERDFFLGLINAPRSHVDVAAVQDYIDRDVKELYLAGPGRGWLSNDIATFIKIITKHDNEYLAALNVAYGCQHGDTLVKAVEKQFGNNVLGKGMGAMILDRSDFYASELNQAIKGAGTDTDTLTRIIATQRHTMPAICRCYMLKYRKNLRQHLQQERAVGDTNYGKVLLSLLKVAEATGGKADLPSLSTTSEPSSTPSTPPQPAPGPSLETRSSSSPGNPPPERPLETRSNDNLGRPSSGPSLATHSYNSLDRMGHVPLPGVPRYPTVPAPGAAYPSADPFAPFNSSSSGDPTNGYPTSPYTTAPQGYPADPYTAAPYSYPASPYAATPYSYPADPGYGHPAYTATAAQYPTAAYTYPQQDDGSPSCPPAPDYMAHAFARISMNKIEEDKLRAERERKVAEQRAREDAQYAQQEAASYERTRVLEQQQREAKIAAERAHARRIEEGDARLAKELQEAEEEAANQRARQQAAIAALEKSRREQEAIARARAREREAEDARYAQELAEQDRQAAATAQRLRQEFEAEQAAERARAQQRAEEADRLYAQQLQQDEERRAAAEVQQRQAAAAEEQRRQAALAEEQRRRQAAAEAAAAARRQEEEDARLAERLYKEQLMQEDARIARQIAERENAGV